MAVKEMRMCYSLNLNMCIPFTLRTKTIQGYASQIEDSQDIQLTNLHFSHLSWFQFKFTKENNCHDLSKSVQILSALMLKYDLGNAPFPLKYNLGISYASMMTCH
jgi:hypothetical protein